MPNWKKVIVSGSDAALNSLNVTSLLSVTGSSNLTGSLDISGSTSIIGNAGTTTFYTNADTLIFTGSVYLSGSIYQTGSLNVTGITSSLFGTASWAQNAITSSHAVNALSASYALTASFALNGGGGGGGAITYHQTSSAVTWSVPHTLNTYTPIVQVYDEDYNQLIPASVSGSSLTTVQITFSTAIAGYAVLSTGGSVTINISGSNATLVQSTPATTWSFYHGLNETYPVFTIFDDNDDVIVPLRIHAENANTASIYFTTARTGTAVAANCGLSGSTFESASWAATASYFTGTVTSASYATFAQTSATASYVLNAVSASYATNIQGGLATYVPLWNTNTSLTSSYLIQSGNILKTRYNNADKGLTLDFNFDSFILGNPGTGNNTYLQVFDGGSVINVYSPSYTYFNDKVGVRIIPTNPGLAVSGSFEVTGPGTTKFMNTNVQITGALNVTGGITGSLHGTASWAQNAITSSYTLNALSASYALSSSHAITASFALTASSALNASDILIYVKNMSGAQINKGTVVRISGAVGDNPLISTASYTDDNNSANTLGITNENIANDSFGYVMTEGKLLGIDTDIYSAGQLLYLGANGALTGSAPVAPLHSVRLGQVLRSQLNNGSMYVRIDNGFELGELHDVRDTTTTSSFGDLLVKSGSVWTNSRQLTGSYELTGSLSATSVTGSFQVTGNSTYSGSQTFTNGFIVLTQVSQSLNFVDDTAAAAGGVPLGGLYRNGNFIAIRIS